MMTSYKRCVSAPDMLRAKFVTGDGMKDYKVDSYADNKHRTVWCTSVYHRFMRSVPSQSHTRLRVTATTVR